MGAFMRERSAITLRGLKLICLRHNDAVLARNICRAVAAESDVRAGCLNDAIKLRMTLNGCSGLGGGCREIVALIGVEHGINTSHEDLPVFFAVPVLHVQGLPEEDVRGLLALAHLAAE